MRDPRFSTLYWGRFVSSMGVWIHNLVAAILAYEISGSAFVVGMVSALQFTPQLVLTPLSGKLTDLGHGAAQIVLGRALCVAGSGGLAAWWWLAPHGIGGAWPLLVSSLVVGLGFSIGGPAMQSVVPNIIRPGELAVAMRLNNAPVVLARALGPAAGAVLIATAPPEVAFAIAAASHLVFLVALRVVRLPMGDPPEAGADQSIAAALRWVRADRPLMYILLGVAAVGIGAEPASTLGPSLADDLGQGGDFAGWIATSAGVGAVVGLFTQRFVLRWVTVRRQGCTGLAMMAVGCAVAGLSAWPVVTLAAFGVQGAGLSVAMSGLGTLAQYRSPAALRGRIMALWLVGFVGSRPLAATVDGFVADHVSVATPMLLSATLVGFMAYLTRPAVVSHPLPPPPR